MNKPVAATTTTSRSNPRIRRYKISCIGAGGNVGATAAKWIAEKELGDVVLLDIAEGIPQGKALDLMQSGAIKGFSTQLRGSNDFKDIADSDVVVVTAGLARKPGMTREDLLQKNTEIIKDISHKIKEYAAESIVVLVTNPLDIMTYVALKETGFESNRVFGMAGVLDTARYKTFLAMELGVSVEDISGMTLGGHGDYMVPLVDFTNVNGIPIRKLLSREAINGIVERTQKGGAEIVGLLKNGSAYYAPAAAAVEMVEAIIHDKRRVLPVCTLLNGEFGITDVCVGVPVVLGANGVNRILELDLSYDERKQLTRSAEIIGGHLSDLGYKD